MKILVIDNRIVASLIKSMLEQLGYQATIAQTAEEARNDIDAEQPDVIICDLAITDGGFEKVMKMRQEIPLLAITATSPSYDQVQKLEEHGILGILKKPFTIDQLGNTMRQFAAQHESAPR